MVSALISSRDATFDLGSLPSRSIRLPPLGQASQLDRWEPWVRAYLGVQELLTPLCFEPTAGKTGLQLFHLKQTKGGAAPTFGSLPVVAIERPQPAVFKDQIKLVMAWAELRDDRAAEILAQIDPQYAFWGSVLPMQPQRVRRTLEFVNIVLQFAVSVEMRFKHALACWRPNEYSAQVQPLITTPGHGSFPSGHSTQAYIVAQVLKALLKLTPAKHQAAIVQLDRQAARIATNRVVAGVHYPIDSMAGRLLGCTLADYVVARCVPKTSWTAFTFDGSQLDGREDLDPTNQPLTGNNLPPFHVAGQAGLKGADSPLLQHLWKQAQNEWKLIPSSMLGG